MKHIQIVCADGPRRGRCVMFPEGTKQFQINVLDPDAGFGVWAYVGLIYDVVYAWGLGVPIGMLNRIVKARREF